MQLGRTQVSAMELQPTCASAAGLYSSYEAGAPAPSRATSADTRPLDMLRELLLWLPRSPPTTSDMLLSEGSPSNSPPNALIDLGSRTPEAWTRGELREAPLPSPPVAPPPDDATLLSVPPLPPPIWIADSWGRSCASEIRA